MLGRFYNKSFTEMFNNLKAENQGVSDLSEQRLVIIEKELLSIKEREESNLKKGTYFISLALAAFFPLIIGCLYSLTKSWGTVLTKLLIQKDFLNSHLEFNLYFTFLFFATITYTILMPSGFPSEIINIVCLKMIKKISNPLKFIEILHTSLKFRNKDSKIKSIQHPETSSTQSIDNIKESEENLSQVKTIKPLMPKLWKVKKPGKRFITFAVICNYLNLLIPMMYLYSYANLPLHNSILIIIIWMIIPLLVFTFICLITPIVVILMLSIHNSELKLSREYPLLIIAYLVFILDFLSSKKGFPELRESDKDLLIESIFKISLFIRNMYSLKTPQASKIVNDSLNLWSSEQMEIASQNFLSLIIWVLFPQENTYTDLKIKLLNYLNIFITGQYHALPREKTEMDNNSRLLMNKSIKIKSYFPTMLLGFNMALPIIVYILIQKLFQISISPELSLMFNILYLIWAVVIFTLYAGNLSSDAKAFIKDIISSIIKKN
ncbi:MAG TPA: hypothetical protein VF941_21820 [Clostridia bacterium]